MCTLYVYTLSSSILTCLSMLLLSLYLNLIYFNLHIVKGMNTQTNLQMCKNRIQGEVVTSNEPKWINHAEISNSNLSHVSTTLKIEVFTELSRLISDMFQIEFFDSLQELKGTLVLIPVAGGLVELYNSKLVTINLYWVLSYCKM